MGKRKEAYAGKPQGASRFKPDQLWSLRYRKVAQDALILVMVGIRFPAFSKGCDRQV